MPKISKEALDTVFYLYEDREKALEGVKFGGTGFIIGFPSKKYPDKYYYHGVSNHHVVLSGGYSVIRLNIKGGGVDTIDLEPTEWEFFSNKEDIAVSPPLNLDNDLYQVSSIPLINFAVDELVEALGIDVGDDVFMIGRFIDHDGGATNLPSARFGNISVMPAPIRQKNGYMVKSYCLDMHSRTGYSGSPVFVYRTITGDLDEVYRNQTPFASVHSFINLLGIHWGQFGEEIELEQIKIKKDKSEETILIEGAYAKGMSGMTCVIPAQKIYELLNSPVLIKKRELMDIELEKRLQQERKPPMAESISNEMNPQHKEDFNSLVSAAVKKTPQDDET